MRVTGVKQEMKSPVPFRPVNVSRPTEVISVGAPVITSSKDDIFVVGGIDIGLGKEKPGMCVSVYDSEMRKWNMLTYLPMYTHHHAAVSVGGKLYLMGGAIYDPRYPDDLGTATNKVYVYNIQEGTWTSVANMTECRVYHGAAVYNDMIYVVGGEDSNKK